jgi:outer membrane autotransporter protein
MVGADGTIGANGRLGLIAGYDGSSFSSDARAYSGSVNAYHLGLYGGARWGAFGVSAGAAHSWSRVRTARAVTVGALTDVLTAGYDTGTTQVFGEVDYRIDTASASFSPFASLAHLHLRTGGFTETGAAAALTHAASTMQTTFSTIGLRAETEFMLAGMRVAAHGMAGWRHAFGDVTPLAQNAFAGGAGFTVAGAPIDADAAVLDAGLTFSLAPQARLGVSYGGQFGRRTVEHGGRLDLKVAF